MLRDFEREHDLVLPTKLADMLRAQNGGALQHCTFRAEVPVTVDEVWGVPPNAGANTIIPLRAGWLADWTRGIDERWFAAHRLDPMRVFAFCGDGHHVIALDYSHSRDAPRVVRLAFDGDLGVDQVSVSFEGLLDSVYRGDSDLPEELPALEWSRVDRRWSFAAPRLGGGMDRFSGTLGVTAEGAFAVAQVHRYGGDVEAHVVFIASGESEPLFETPSQSVVDHLAGAVRFSVAGPTMTRTHASGRAGAPWSVTRWECDGFDVVVPSDDPWVTFAKRWADDEYTQWRWRSGGFVEDESASPTPPSPRNSGADAQRRARLAAKLKPRTRDVEDSEADVFDDLLSDLDLDD